MRLQVMLPEHVVIGDVQESDAFGLFSIANSGKFT